MDAISQLILAKGAANADAAMARGNRYAGLVAGLGSIPGQIQEQQAHQAAAQLQAHREQRLQEVADLQAQKQAFDLNQARTNAANESATGQIIASSFDENGKPDRAKVKAAVENSGRADLWPKINAALDTYDTHAADLAAKQATTQKTQQEVTAKRIDARGAIGAALEKTGNDPGTFSMIMAQGVKDGSLTQEEADDAIRRAHDDPAFVGTLSKSWIDASPTQQANLEKAAKAKKEGQVNNPQNLKPFSLNGKRILGVESKDPETGAPVVTYQGQDVTGKVAPISDAPHITVTNPASASTMKDNARQLYEGNLLPSMLSKRGGEFNATLAEANRISKEETGHPINLVKLQNDAKAAERFASSLNGPQQIKFRALADSVQGTIGEVNDLAEQLKQGGVAKWNEAKRDTLRNVYGNTEYSDLANRYVTAVNTLKEEFANLASGGFAPTESAWHLANDQINANYGFKDLHAQLNEINRLIGYRVTGLNNQRPQFVPTTGYQEPAAAPAAPAAAPAGAKPVGRFNPATGQIEVIK